MIQMLPGNNFRRTQTLNDMNEGTYEGWSGWSEEAFDLLMQLLYGMMKEPLFSLADNPQARIREYSELTAQLSFYRYLFSVEPGRYTDELSQKMEEAHLTVIRDMNALREQNRFMSNRNHLERLRMASVIARNRF
jgi:hypothetical protein